MALATTSIYNIFSLHNSLIQSNLVGVKFNDIVPNWYRRTPRRNTMELRNAFKKVWFNHKIPVFIRIQLMTIHFILWRILENFKMIGQRKYVTQIIIHHLFASVSTDGPFLTQKQLLQMWKVFDWKDGPISLIFVVWNDFTVNNGCE